MGEQDLKPQWYQPNNFFLSMRCTEAQYAKNFIDKGQIKFNTPQSWVDWELSNGKGRGDLREGTIAYCDMWDSVKVAEFYEKYKSGEFIARIIDNRIHIKRKRSMNLPAFCFYILKHSQFQCPSKTGRQKMVTEIPASYYRDFADNMTPEQVDALPDGKKPAYVLLRNYDEFKNRLSNKLKALGLVEEEIIYGDVTYYDINEFGETGYCEFRSKPPTELLWKEISFSHQSEARVIINTDKQEIIDHLLGQAIEIGSLNDIADYRVTYLHEGVKIEMYADICEA
jgi:hypothetical protein